MKFPNFHDWLESRSGDSKPERPLGMDKIGHKEEKSSGTRDGQSDLSADYKGHIKHNGTVEPYKVLKKAKGSKPVAPVAS